LYFTSGRTVESFCKSSDGEIRKDTTMFSVWTSFV
jgi:hypothetical protein